MLHRNSRVLTQEGYLEVSKLTGKETLQSLNYGYNLQSAELKNFSMTRDIGSLVKVTTEKQTLMFSSSLPVFMAHPRNTTHFDILLLEREYEGAALGVARPFPSLPDDEIIAYRTSGGNKAKCERYWIIERHNNREKTLLGLHYLACHYGLPIVALSSGWQGIDRQDLENFFKIESTIERAESLRSDYGLKAYLSHLTIRLLDQIDQLRRLFIDFSLFSDHLGHKLNIGRLNEAEVNKRGVYRPIREESLTFESCSKALSYLNYHYPGEFVDIQIRAKFAGRYFSLFPASYIRQGMLLPTLEPGNVIGTEKVKNLEFMDSSDLLYCFSADDLPTLVIQGVITANPIFEYWKKLGLT